MLKTIDMTTKRDRANLIVESLNTSKGTKKNSQTARCTASISIRGGLEQQVCFKRGEDGARDSGMVGAISSASPGSES